MRSEIEEVISITVESCTTFIFFFFRQDFLWPTPFTGCHWWTVSSLWTRVVYRSTALMMNLWRIMVPLHSLYCNIFGMSRWKMLTTQKVWNSPLTCACNTFFLKTIKLPKLTRVLYVVIVKSTVELCLIRRSYKLAYANEHVHKIRYFTCTGKKKGEHVWVYVLLYLLYKGVI